MMKYLENGLPDYSDEVTLDYLTEIALDAVSKPQPEKRKIVFCTDSNGLELMHKMVCERVGVEYTPDDTLATGWYTISSEEPFITKHNPEGFKIDKDEKEFKK